MGKVNVGIDKRLLVVLIAATTIVVILWHGKATSKPALCCCAQLHAEGYYRIPRSSSLYRAQLDRDGDGLACE